MIIKFLEEEIAKCNTRLAQLIERSQKSGDLEEVRRLGTEIDEVKDQIKRFEQEKAEALAAEQKAKNPIPAPKANTEGEDILRSEGYRQAFMAYIQRGVAIPQEYVPELKKRAAEIARAAGTTVTSEVPALTPATVLDIVARNEASDRYGVLYRRVNHTFFEGNVEIPISEMAVQCTWQVEGTCPTGDKAGNATDRILFKSNLLFCQVNYSLLVGIQSLPVFERELGRLMREAILKELDRCIVLGTGVGQPEGITVSPRVTKSVTLSPAEIDDWKTWQKKVIAAIPGEKIGGHIVLAKSTVDSHIKTLTNDNNNPLFFSGALSGRNPNTGDVEDSFLGQWVLSLGNGILKDYDAASEDDIVGFYAPLDDYSMNVSIPLGVERFYDQKCIQWIIRQIIAADGHPVDTGGMILIKKGAAAARAAKASAPAESN